MKVAWQKAKSHGYVHDSSSLEDMPPAVIRLPASAGPACKSLHLCCPMPAVGSDTAYFIAFALMSFLADKGQLTIQA